MGIGNVVGRYNNYYVYRSLSLPLSCPPSPPPLSLSPSLHPSPSPFIPLSLSPFLTGYLSLMTKLYLFAVCINANYLQTYLYDSTEPACIADVLEPNGHVPLSLSLVRIERIDKHTGHRHSHPGHVGIVVSNTRFQSSAEVDVE